MSDASGGRAELDRLLAGHSARTRELAARAAREVEKRVAAGQHAAQAVTEAMEAVGMAKGVRDTVGTAVVQSLCVGAGIWPSVKALPVDDQASLRKTALSGMWDGSGMTLSQTLHGTTKAMHDDVVKAVQGHIDNKATAWDSSRKIYDGYGFGGTIHQAKLPELPQDLQKLVDDARKVLSPADLAKLQADAKRLSAYADRLATGPLKAAYGQMARRLEKGLTDGLGNLVRTATEEKARYHANRILRTESARAWGHGFHKECMDDPDVVGWKWRTSSAHKVFDICDFHAQADLYGMGPGVYPKDRHPSYPAHPHCFCNASKAYKGMVPDQVDQVEAGGKAALQAMTEEQRRRLLTLQGSKAFGQGGAWQGSLRQWSPPGGMGLSSGAQAVLKEAEAKIAGPALERSASDAMKRVEQIAARAKALSDRGRPITGARATQVQKSIEKALGVQYPAKISAFGKLTVDQAGGMDRLSKILSERAVPNGISVSARQIPVTGTSSHTPGTGKIQIRKNASPGIMAHELMHAADDQNQELFDAIAAQVLLGAVADDFQPGLSPKSFGYANKVYPRGSTEYMTRGAEHILDRALMFYQSDAKWFKRVVELLRGEWEAR